MIYAMSDLHGCYDKFIKMLEKIDFKEDDTLYILGDVIDRGPDGIKLLLDIYGRKNVVALRGNHDYLCYYLLWNINSGSEKVRDAAFINKCRNWFLDGGEPTYTVYKGLNIEDKKRVLNCLYSMPIYEEIEVGGRKFFLSHTVPEKHRMLHFDSLLWQEFIIGEPEYEKEYYPDKFIVTGHTPTSFIDPASRGRIWKKNNHIAIDCGAVFGNSLGCLCLDTLKEFYVE